MRSDYTQTARSLHVLCRINTKPKTILRSVWARTQKTIWNKTQQERSRREKDYQAGQGNFRCVFPLACTWINNGYCRDVDIKGNGQCLECKWPYCNRTPEWLLWCDSHSDVCDSGSRKSTGNFWSSSKVLLSNRHSTHEDGDASSWTKRRACSFTVLYDFMLILNQPVPLHIPSQRCHINRDTILNSNRAVRNCSSVSVRMP